MLYILWQTLFPSKRAIQMRNVEREEGHYGMDLEKINFQNSIYFYKDELKQIRDGVLSTSILTPPESKRFFKYGILHNRKLTPEAEQYLNLVLSGATK